MRKNTARHWLHAILDLLPVLVIPIFALQVRSDNGFEPISIEYNQDKVVDFNQQLKPQYITNNPSFMTYTYDSATNSYNMVVTNSGEVYQTGLRLSSSVSYYIEHIYLMSFESDDNVTFYSGINQTNTPITLYGSRYAYRLQISSSNTRGLVGLINPGSASIKNFMFFDLTQMFGAGNEPSVFEFFDYFQEDYYDWTLSQKVLVTDFVKTYNDTDVGSQTIYTLYRTVDNYFNLSNVFNLKNVYQWFVVNIFGGQAPLSIYIVWNIVLYEFVMDLLFLLYGLFMWFIDMCKRLMEKPLDSIK